VCPCVVRCQRSAGEEGRDTTENRRHIHQQIADLWPHVSYVVSVLLAQEGVALPHLMLIAGGRVEASVANVPLESLSTFPGARLQSDKGIDAGR
jgi:hypothetical protein